MPHAVPDLPTTNCCATRTLVDPERNRSVGSAWEATNLLRNSTGRVQVLGSRFSYPSLIEGHDGLAIHLRNPEHVLSFDDHCVTVTGDCTLTGLWEHLRAHGQTLPSCPPVITAQTVAGAIGTHAPGIREADCVLSIDFIDARGGVRRVAREDEEFGAFQLHLGALGFITAITLAVTPNDHYVCRSFYDYRDTEGDLVEIFRIGIPAPQINMEVGVPMEQFEAAVTDLRKVVTDSAYRLHYPVILRPTGPSEAWLAAAYHRPTCWFGLVVYQRADGSVADGSVDLLGEIQSTLADHGGLPPWGKYFDPVRYDFGWLPRWRDFAAVRRRHDPHDRFLNPALGRLLETR